MLYFYLSEKIVLYTTTLITYLSIYHLSINHLPSFIYCIYIYIHTHTTCVWKENAFMYIIII